MNMAEGGSRPNELRVIFSHFLQCSLLVIPLGFPSSQKKTGTLITVSGRLEFDFVP